MRSLNIMIGWAAGLALLAGSTIHAAIITNGDFESTTATATATFNGWQELVGATPTDVASAVTGSNAITTTSALMQAASSGNGDLKQSVASGPSQFRLEFDFAIYTDRPRASYSTGFLQLYVKHATNGQAQIRVTRPSASGGAATDPADVVVYTGSADLLALDDAVSVSTSLTDLKVNHMTIDMVYGAPSSYVISVRDADGVTHTSSSLTQFTGVVSNAGSKLTELDFNRGYLSYHSTYSHTTAVLDNVTVSVPEPGAMALAILGLTGAMGLLRRRRR